MDINEYYLLLRRAFPEEQENSEFTIKRDDLATIFQCTERNVIFIIKKLQESNMIHWKSGKGRGNLSTIVFVARVTKVIEKIATNLVKNKGAFGEAKKLFEDNGLYEESDSFQNWMKDQFGFYKEKQQVLEYDILRFPFYRPVLDLDPTYVSRRTETHYVSQIFDTLVSYDSNTKLPQPNIAHYWEQNESGTRWIFYLKKGILFHNGQELTSEDVVLTFERMKTGNRYFAQQWLLEKIKKVIVRNRYTVQIDMTESFPLFIYFLCMKNFCILPKNLGGKSPSDFEKNPIGTGPYKIVENSEDCLIVESFAAHFKGRPFLDRVEMYVLVANYQGNLFLETNEPQFKIQDEQELNTLEHENIIENGANYLVFNQKKDIPFLKDVNFRKAVHVAINRKKMVEDLNGLRNKPASGFYPDLMDDGYIKADKEEAIQLLRQSAYQGEKLELFTYEMPSNEENAAWLQKELEEIGVRINIVIYPVRELLRKDTLQKADILLGGEILGEIEELVLLELYKKANGMIANSLPDHAINWINHRLFTDGRVQDLSDLKIVLQEIESELKNNYHVLFLYHSQNMIRFSKGFKGISLNTLGWVDYKNIWLKDVGF